MNKMMAIVMSVLSFNAYSLDIDKSSVNLGDLQLGVPFSERRLVSFVVTNNEAGSADSMSLSLTQAAESDQDKMFKILRNTCTGSLAAGASCSVLIKAQPALEGDLDNPSYITPEGALTASFSIASSQGVLPFTISANVDNIVSLQKAYPIDIVRDNGEDQRYRVALKDESTGEVSVICPAATGDSIGEAYCGSLDALYANKDCEERDLKTNLGQKMCGLVVQVIPKDSEKVYELKLSHRLGDKRHRSCSSLYAFGLITGTEANQVIYPDGEEALTVDCEMIDGQMWTKMAQKMGTVYAPLDVVHQGNQGTVYPIGFYNLGSHSTGTYSKSLFKFKREGEILLKDGGYRYRMLWNGLENDNALFKYVSSANLGNKMNSLAPNGGAFNLRVPNGGDWFGFYSGTSITTEEGCGIYERNATDPLNAGLFRALPLSHGDWSTYDSQNLCPNGIAAHGDYNYNGYGWNVVNYSASGNNISVYYRETIVRYPKSCKEYIERDPSLAGKDGIYTIDADGAEEGSSPEQVYCNMTHKGGGWTLALASNKDVPRISGYYNNFWYHGDFRDAETLELVPTGVMFSHNGKLDDPSKFDEIMFTVDTDPNYSHSIPKSLWNGGTAEVNDPRFVRFNTGHNGQFWQGIATCSSGCHSSMAIPKDETSISSGAGHYSIFGHTNGAPSYGLRSSDGMDIWVR